MIMLHCKQQTTCLKHTYMNRNTNELPVAIASIAHHVEINHTNVSHTHIMLPNQSGKIDEFINEFDTTTLNHDRSIHPFEKQSRRRFMMLLRMMLQM
mmetsp:Transcript_22434/g.34405  ORF Transcript_22434/g.34405 Transcript_22434/m.34405 type:complete len:97 (-) Transcript_22434:238-528(-)